MSSIKSVITIWMLVCVGVSGCVEEESPPPDLIKEDTYIDLLVEMQLVKSYQERVLPDSVIADSLIPRVMANYNVTEDQFRRSHTYYQQQISEQQQRISEAIDRLRRDQYAREPSHDGLEELN